MSNFIKSTDLAPSILNSTSKSLEEIFSSNNLDELRASLQKAVEAIGFDTFNFATGKKTARELMTSPTVSSWSYDDLVQYDRDKWFERDPLLKYAISQDKPMMWNISDWENHPERDYFHYLRASGIAGGITVPLSEAFGALTMLSLSDKKHNPETLHAANIIAQATKAQSARVGVAGADVPTSNLLLQILSDEQKHILMWISQGKSNSDIATILNKSKRSVDYHTSEILRKLEVSSRSKAVALFVKRSSL